MLRPSPDGRKGGHTSRCAGNRGTRHMILAPRGRGPKDDYRRSYSLARCSAGVPVPWIRYRTVRDTYEGAAGTRDVRCDAPGDKKHEADGLHVRLLGPDCFRRGSSLVPLSIREVSRTGESFLHGRVDPASRTCWTPCFSLLDGPHSPFCLGSFSVDVATVHILPLPGPCHVSLVFSDGSKSSPPFPSVPSSFSDLPNPPLPDRPRERFSVRPLLFPRPEREGGL